MSSSTLPDQIADLLIAWVFTGYLAAGDKLPAERVLANILGVDRTSLRIALRTLIRMNVAKSVQGSGITILDFRKTASLDFLDNVFRIKEMELGIDLLLPGIDLFLSTYPGIVRSAFEKADDETFCKFEALLEKIIHRKSEGAPVVELAGYNIELSDILLDSLDSVVEQLHMNSSRQLRFSLTIIYYEIIDFEKYMEIELAMVQGFKRGLIDPVEFEYSYRASVKSMLVPLFEHIKETFPEVSYLRLSPLSTYKLADSCFIRDKLGSTPGFLSQISKHCKVKCSL